MKAAANGGLNLSVADGWWLEGAEDGNGWSFGHEATTDDEDAHRLYDLLDGQVAPAFYERDQAGLPPRWIAMMRQAMITIPPAFAARRMVSEYARRLYIPA